jgi:GNAT superfamily N-acetyltransferase
MVRDLLALPATVIFLAEIDGAPAGYLYADIDPAQETSMTYRLDRLWIHQISVDPAFRGQGAGTALIDAAKATARVLGISTLALSTWAFNSGGIRFFERQGFEAYNHRMWLHLPM